uniref:Zinc finger BED domain-containing protein RICESLEEPER 2-like n=1 Tax=Tanacetum cinerariifolium TaxID=118510 RepID=A0A699GXG9_TANCI|nr:hypothetical protein [Tanacetum cinerariifolium]
MVMKMEEKFDKYWAEVHLLMSIAAVLVPRVKMWAPGFCFPKIYNPVDAKALIKIVEQTLRSLHSEQNEASPTLKSDLDVYLEDGCHMCAQEDNKNFNILDWWKNHESKYGILSKLARDILAIRITTVASEATFSAGSRVIDKYRASLGVETEHLCKSSLDGIRNAFLGSLTRGTKMIPIAIRGILPDRIRHIITKLCLFFNKIHSKVVDPELKIKTCGPTFLRDMYPFERYIGILKGYVRNRSRPEGSIIEGYATEEAIEFIQLAFHKVYIRVGFTGKNDDEYNQFDELPPFSIGITPSNDVLDDTTYLRSDHNEGLEV